MKNTLADRAVLVSLTISQWSARKYDRKVTQETNDAHGASPDAGRYNKRLLDKDAIGDLNRIAAAARIDFYKRSLPWLDNGARLVSVMALEAFQDDMRKHREAFEKAVAKFVAGYDRAVLKAEKDLNGMFNRLDYPSKREIENRFGFEVLYLPVPAASDFRADVGTVQAEIIRAQIEDATKAATMTAVRDTYQRIADVVGHMSEKLRGYRPEAKKIGDKGLFHHSLVGNVRELVDILPSLNITGDAHLDQITDRMKQALCSTEVSVLRESDTTRKKVQKAAASIMRDVESILG